MTTLTLRRPDDWHLHLRDGEMLHAVIGASARHFGRALIMPNLVPPVVTAADAHAYRQRVLDALAAHAPMAIRWCAPDACCAPGLPS